MKRTTGHTQRRRAPVMPKPAPPKAGKATPRKPEKAKPLPKQLKATPSRRTVPPKKLPEAIVVTPELKRRALRVIDGFKEAYPDAHCELDFTNALEALVASVLAAQSTDAMVNTVTPELFRKYKTPQDYLDVPEDVLKKEIHSTGFFNNKCKSIKNASRALIEKFNGKMPRTMDELVSLPGVGRKTANVILGNVYKVPGIVVDTHMLRIARRLGFTVQTDAEKVERDVMAILPESEWINFSHFIPWHGRRCCTARAPQCETCPVAPDCPKLIE
jgi:endonuclease-3